MKNKNMHDDEIWLCKKGYGLKMKEKGFKFDV